MTTPIYKSGTTVSIAVPLPQVGNSPVTPTAVTATVHDEVGVVLATISPDLPQAGAGVLVFDIPADKNLLNPNARKGARQVEVTFTADEGTFIETAHYLIEAKNQLAILGNTFMTYPEALMVRSDLPMLNGWDAATDSQRIGAMVVAHQSMCNLRYRYRVGATGSQRRLTGFPGTSSDNSGRIWASVSDIRETLDWEWAEMPEDFKTALKRAQLVQADVQLAGDPIGDKRRQGIVSETIGEASMFLKSVPEVRLPVCAAALEHLRGYVTFSVGIARA